MRRMRIAALTFLTFFPLGAIAIGLRVILRDAPRWRHSPDPAQALYEILIVALYFLLAGAMLMFVGGRCLQLRLQARQRRATPSLPAGTLPRGKYAPWHKPRVSRARKTRCRKTGPFPNSPKIGG